MASHFLKKKMRLDKSSRIHHGFRSSNFNASNLHAHCHDHGSFDQVAVPICTVSIQKLTGDQMHWHPVIITFDGASSNQHFVTVHTLSSSQTAVLHKVVNPYADDGREIFFSDSPHLIKTTRNCFASKARLLWVSMYA